MAGLFPLSRQQQLDEDGVPLGGARLFLFDGGTSTPRTGYRDLALSSEHPNPIVADARGRLPLIYLDDGFYRQRLTSATGELIFDDDGIPVLSTSAGGAGTSVDPESVFKTGNLKIDFGDGVIDGYVRCNGRSIGSATSGATERANADTQPLYVKLWAFANISVSGGKGASAAADFAANKALSLPDARARAIFGVDDMGGGASSRVTTGNLGSNPAVVGASGGVQSQVISQANLPSYTLTGGSGSVSASGTTGIEDAAHFHPVVGDTASGDASHAHSYTKPSGSIGVQTGVAGNAMQFNDSGAATTGSSSIAHQHAISITSGSQTANHRHSVTVTGTASAVSISSGGGGAEYVKLPPLMTFTIYMRL